MNGMDDVIAIDLERFGVHELEALGARVAEALRERREQVSESLAEELRKRAAEEGVELNQVLGAVGTNAKKRPARVAPKFRHPKNANLTWSGRGKKPTWLKELLEQGTKLETLRI